MQREIALAVVTVAARFQDERPAKRFCCGKHLPGGIHRLKSGHGQIGADEGLFLHEFVLDEGKARRCRKNFVPAFFQLQQRGRIDELVFKRDDVHLLGKPDERRGIIPLADEHAAPEPGRWANRIALQHHASHPSDSAASPVILASCPPPMMPSPALATCIASMPEIPESFGSFMCWNFRHRSTRTAVQPRAR